jgi:aminopeptidase YwaD
MDYNCLREQITRDLTELCVTIGDRHPGSEQNQRAVSYTFGRMAATIADTVMIPLKCLDWEYGNITLKVGGEAVGAFVGPYNESFQITAPFKMASTIDELANTDAADHILVLHGELCKEQLAPKNFVFYNPEHHQQIIALLEEKNPLAIIAVTGCNPNATRALCPFPLIEDGDFLIPSCYVDEAAGDRIKAQLGDEIFLSMESRRIPSQAHNIIGTVKGKTSERIVFCAHIDTKKDTPGAIDNAGGICLLLALADQLRDYAGKYSIELLVINGEDYYSYPGGMRYLEDNRDRLGEILMVVNSDGAGARGSRTSFCHFHASEEIQQILNSTFRDQNKYLPVDPWYSGDHMTLAMNGVPAVALTTEAIQEILTTVAHTDQDTIDGVDTNILAGVALSLRELIDRLNLLTGS